MARNWLDMLSADCSEVFRGDAEGRVYAVTAVSFQ
jgi:hypothetical protein